MLPVQRRGRAIRAAVKAILGVSSGSMLALAASAQEAAPTATALDEVVVTGYRASLEQAIDVKRNETAIVDVIKSEDIAKFPDLNLAESLQRIPGVSIDRDGGEGRTIVIRGLGPEFTRVRLNGLEALATSGGKDNSGGVNRGRSFDFNIFASDLFNSITVRKAQSAEVEEGSLGATVDLATAHPFDYNGFTLTFAAQGAYSDLTEELTPRATFLVSDTWLDGRLGALLSVAFTKREILEEGSSTVRWESPSVTGNTSGNFQTAPAGVAAAWHPRIPRYGRTAYDQERLGMTFAVQAKPWEGGEATLDVLYAKLTGSRQEEYLEAISFSRAGQGMPQTDVTTAIIDGNNNLIAGVFNDVDVRTEQRFDDLSTTFKQYSLSFEQQVTDRLELKATLGTSKSVQENPIQTTLSFERYDTDGYIYDYRGNQRLPDFGYGFDVTNPASFVYSSSTALGDASLVRMRPNETTNAFDIVTLDAKFEINDTFAVKGGALFKKYEFKTVEARRSTENAPAALNGIPLGPVSELVTGFGRNLPMPAGVPRTWVVPSIDAFIRAFGIHCNCVNEYGDFRVSTTVAGALASNRSVSEDDIGAFVQLDLNTQIAGMPFRGNVGARYVTTDLSSTGYVGTTPTTVDNDYDDFLPSINAVLELTDEIFLRAGASKVMSRPQLPTLTPGGTISNGARTITSGNPLLEPIRATTVDLSAEWYPAGGALVSFGVFYKDLASYIQRAVHEVPYSETGLPPELLQPPNTPDTIFTVTQEINSPGGDLKGYEISVQSPFTFLPAPFDGFGGIVNYTHVQSDITYVTQTTPVVLSTVEPLVNLSPNSWNATLYFENDRFSVRGTAAYRDDYVRLVPGGSGADVAGKFATLNVDLSASYTITETFEVTLEAINLTDEYDDRWQSRARQNSESYEHTGVQYFLGFRAKL